MTRTRGEDFLLDKISELIRERDTARAEAERLGRILHKILEAERARQNS